MATRTGSNVATIIAIAAIIGVIALVKGGPEGDNEPHTGLPSPPANCETNDLQECVLLEVRFEPPLRKPRDVHVVATVEGQSIVNEWPVSSSWAKYVNVRRGMRIILTSIQFSGEFLKCVIFVGGRVKSEDSMDGVNESGVTCIYMATG